MLKAALRQAMLQKRRQYLPEEVEARSLEICRQFFNYFNFNQRLIIHIFLPIAHQNEVNTWHIINYLRGNYPQMLIAVPVTNVVNQQLTHSLLIPETKITLNNWGIPEPVNPIPITEQQLDMVLVPLLAFDEKGQRVGYGKGFYDRFLAKCRPDTITVGLSLLNQMTPTIADVHEGDVTLQHVVTPTQVYCFK